LQLVGTYQNYVVIELDIPNNMDTEISVNNRVRSTPNT